MPKPQDSSPFDALTLNRSTRIPGTQSTESPDIPVNQVPGKLIKSKDPNYTRLTFYLKKDLDTKVRQKVAGLPKEQREISDALEKLVEAWIDGRVQLRP